MSQRPRKQLPLIIVVALVLILGVAGGFFISQNQSKLPLIKNLNQEKEEQNRYLTFLKEVRQVVVDNYWDTINETDFVQLHVRAIEKLTAQPLGNQVQTYEELDQKILEILNEYQDEQQKQEFTTQLADIVLANLPPFGRSRLYSKQLEQELVEKVNNIDPEADHYQALGVDKQASQEEIAQAYQEKKQALEQEDSPEAQKYLAQVETAHQTLKDEKTRARYDEAGVNPTMEWGLPNPNVFYLKIKQFSPTTVQELAEVAQKVDDKDENLNSLILDLRGNIGGAIDGLPYFLGPFIGNNQYAYQFIQQGKTTDFKTRTGWLPSLKRYKKVVILIDENTQSSAEVMASVLKKYNVGVLVGTTTKGWGTIERVFSLKNQINDSEEYSVFLVHHLTLREDGAPIEGNGVEPMVNVQEPDWKQQLAQYFDDPNLLSAVEQEFATFE
jgi:hypothetical protein